MDHIRAMRIGNQFNVDTPQNSPNPQASSTLMKERPRKDSRASATLYSEKLSTCRTNGSTNSSLGVIDVDTISAFTDSEKENSQSFKTRFAHFEKFLENEQFGSRSRISKRLDEISSTLSSEFGDVSDDTDDDEIYSTSVCSEDRPKYVSTVGLPNPARDSKSKPSAYNTFCLDSLKSKSAHVSGNSTDGFVSGSQIELKLVADQKNNKKEFGSLPVSPINFSVLSDEYAQSGATDYLGAGSYSAAEISDLLRNRMKNKEIFVNKLMGVSLNNEDDGTVISSTIGPTQKVQSVALSDTYDTSAVSSIASFNQIAKILNERSAEPEVLTERLLSKGMSKTKPSTSKSEYAEQPSSSVGSVNLPKSKQRGLEKNKDIDHVSDIAAERRGSVISTKTDSDSHSTTRSTIGSIKYGHSSAEVNTCKEKYNNSNLKSDTRNLGSLSSPKIFYDETLHLKLEKRPNCIPEKGYFRLYKTSSDFETCDINDDCSECSSISSYMCLTAIDFLQNDVNNFNFSTYDSDPNITLASPCTANFVKTSRLKEGLIQQNNACKSNSVDPVKEIASTHNLAKNDTNDGDHKLPADHGNEVINAGLLCVGTQVKVVLGITNPSKKILHYKIKLNNVALEGSNNVNAACVMSSASVLTVLPSADTEVSIVITPLVCGVIRVILEFISQDKTFSNIIKAVEVTGKNPTLKLMQPENCSLYYGLLAEYTQKKLPLTLKNNNALRTPLRFVIYEGPESNDIVYVAKVTLEPDETFVCGILVMTPEVAFKLDKDSANTLELTGRLCIMLDTIDDKLLSNSAPLYTIQLCAKVGFTNLSIKNSTPLKLFTSGYPKWSVSDNLYVHNSGVIPLDIVTKIYGDSAKEFSIEPANFKITPFHQDTLKIHFKPVTNDVKRKVDLCFLTQGSRKRFLVPIYGIIEESVVSSTSPKHDLPVASNPGTPRSSSSSSSSTYADGALDLACTHTVLIWSNTPVHMKQTQIVTLRNKGNHREKLVLSVSDNYGSFKLLENEMCLKELKITLEPGESRKIAVAFIPYVSDQQVSGKIKIYRRNNLESSTSVLNKRVLPLYGYGGDAKISIQNVFRDSEGRIWLNPDADTLETKFVVENIGDSVAFVKIVQEEPDDVMYPEEILLSPAESAEITFKLRLTTDRVDLLCKQNQSKDIFVANKLIIFHGSEATRQRISRLWLKVENISDLAIRRVSDKIDVISSFGEQSSLVSVNELLDPLQTMSKLWYEGVTEEAIGILIDRESLESLCLDTTVIFKDLNTTMAVE